MTNMSKHKNFIHFMIKLFIYEALFCCHLHPKKCSNVFKGLLKERLPECLHYFNDIHEQCVHVMHCFYLKKITLEFKYLCKNLKNVLVFSINYLFKFSALKQIIMCVISKTFSSFYWNRFRMPTKKTNNLFLRALYLAINARTGWFYNIKARDKYNDHSYIFLGEFHPYPITSYIFSATRILLFAKL